MRNRIVSLLVWALIRIAPKNVVEAIAAELLRGTGYAVLEPSTVDVTLSTIRYQRARLRKMGGGNASKLRDPRKTLSRLARNFERVVEEAARR